MGHTPQRKKRESVIINTDQVFEVSKITIKSVVSNRVGLFQFKQTLIGCSVKYGRRNNLQP